MSRAFTWVPAAALLLLLLVPLLALGTSVTPEEFVSAARSPEFAAALGVSLRTSAVSLALIVVGGTPLAWWLAAGHGRGLRALEVVVDLPIVVPPAVVGVGLLAAFGRSGWLSGLGPSIAFTEAAVVLAQVVVASPFYVQSATNAFRKVDADLIVVARTLGATPGQAFLRVAVPVAFPGLLAGAALAWARALGEFGATLLFAGNLRGHTQTMPLAIYSALETDVRLAIALSLVLVCVGVVLLCLLRFVPTALRLAPASSDARRST